MISRIGRTLHLLISLSLVGFGGMLGVISPARADIFQVTIEAPGVQTPQVANICGGNPCTIGTETFDAVLSGLPFVTVFGTGGIITGDYSGDGLIFAPDQFGGAGGVGQYIVTFSSTGYKIDLGTTLSTGLNYFGFWLSALDAGNQLTFFNGATPVFSFSPADVLAFTGPCPNPYCGNPNPNFSGQDPEEPFAFLNFFDRTGTFDSIVFSENPVGGGYESDNHTVGYATGESGTPIPEPMTLGLLGIGLAGLGFARGGRKQ